MSTESNQKVARTQARNINAGRCIPFLSNFVTLQHLFEDEDRLPVYTDQPLVETWANEVGYPMIDTAQIARVAQYVSIVEYSGDEIQAKEDYLLFLKNQLFEDVAAQQTLPQPLLDTIKSELNTLSVSDLAQRLRLIDFESDTESMMAHLAQMNFSIYLTTSPFTFLEESLRANGKPNVVTAYYQWSDTIFDNETLPPDYTPTPQEPLVYHFHGLESIPESIVLTEDNFFEFFAQLARDIRNEEDRLPTVIRLGLARSSILLLGFSLNSWAFRFMFRGVIRDVLSRNRLNMRNVTAQFAPKSEGETTESDAQIQTYLKRFFTPHQFDIYWGSIEQFIQEVWNHL